MRSSMPRIKRERERERKKSSLVWRESLTYSNGGALALDAALVIQEKKDGEREKKGKEEDAL